MHVRVESVFSDEEIPTNEELASFLQALIDNCCQVIAVNFFSQCSGRGMFTVSYQHHEKSKHNVSPGEGCNSPFSAKVRVLSVTTVTGLLPADEQLANALQELLDEFHQIIAVTTLSSGQDRGEYKISYLDYSEAAQPTAEMLSFKARPPVLVPLCSCFDFQQQTSGRLS